MDPSDFVNNLFGELRWADNGSYCYFVPNPLPLEIEIPRDLQKRFYQTLIKLSKLDGRIYSISNHERDLILEAFVLKEATLSSAIEGTRSTLNDMYKEEKESEKDLEKARDNQEVRNYKEALRVGLERLGQNENISHELLLEMHSLLMKGVRGKDKDPGSFRKTSVAIGKKVDTFVSAKFVPPSPAEIIPLLRNLLEFISYDQVEPIEKTAHSHYQFETIHPFKDGNGRVGRLLVMFMLYKEGILRYPVLYLSEYFNNNRDEYVARLYEMSSKGNYKEWFNFFLDALDSQVNSSMSLMDSMEQYRSMFYEISKKEKIDSSIVDILFKNPYVTAKDVAENVGISVNTAHKALEILVGRGIISEVPGKRKGKLFVAKDILDMLER